MCQDRGGSTRDHQFSAFMSTGTKVAIGFEISPPEIGWNKTLSLFEDQIARISSTSIPLESVVRIIACR